MVAPVLPFFLAVQGKLIKQVIRAGALSEETAMSAKELALSDHTIVQKLLAQGIIAKTKEGKYYANTERLSKNLIWKSYIKRHTK